MDREQAALSSEISAVKVTEAAAQSLKTQEKYEKGNGVKNDDWWVYYAKYAAASDECGNYKLRYGKSNQQIAVQGKDLVKH